MRLEAIARVRGPDVVLFISRYEDKVQANPLVKDRYCFRAGDWYRATGR